MKAEDRGFDLVVLVVFAALSSWVLALDLWQVVAHGLHWTGTDGVFVEDQMEYAAWIRSASQHVLASDLFLVRTTPADYLQPVILLSGRLVALGMAPWLALLIWKPVFIVAVFFTFRAFVRRTLSGQNARRAALVIALFFTGPGEVLVVKVLHVNLVSQLQWQVVTGDAALMFWSWGYPFAMLGLATLVAAVLGYERDRAAGRPRWTTLLLALLTSSLHPWQGATLILVLICAEALMWRRGERPALGPPILTIFAASLPLLYYVILERADPLWRLGLEAQSGHWPLGIVLLCLAPLALPAALAYRSLPRTFMSSIVWAWPPIALFIFIADEQTGGAATHAFLGVSLPLAVLAVRGVAQLAWPRTPRYRWTLGVLAIAAVTVPGIAYEMNLAHRLTAPGPVRGLVNGSGDANFITEQERQALSFLARAPQPGGVLTRAYLGEVVPAVTGRTTWVGNSYWSLTPSGGTFEFYRRVSAADALFQGRMSAEAARRFVRSTGARYLLFDCESHANLDAALASMVQMTRHFGCASVYRLG